MTVIAKLPSISSRKHSLEPLEVALTTVPAPGTPKTQLPAVIPSAIFPPKSRSLRTANVAGHTGIIGLDVDLGSNPGLSPEDAAGKAAAWPHAYITKQSVSGGVHLYVKVLPIPTKATVADRHKDVAQAAIAVLERDTGLRADLACVDVVHRFYVSPHLPTINVNAEPLVPELALAPEGERHNTFLTWSASQYYTYGVPKQAIREALDQGNRHHGNFEPEAILRSMVDNLEDLKDPEEGRITVDSLHDIIAVIGTTTFRARRSVLTRTLEYSTDNGATWSTPLESSDTVDGLRLILPPMLWTGSGRKITYVPDAPLRSGIKAVTADYNPLEAIINALQDTPASDQDVEDAVLNIWSCDPQEYPDRVDILDSLYADVALRMLLAGNPDVHARPFFMLTLQGPQGCGKTGFVEQLLPPQFHPYVGQLTATTKKDAIQQVASRVLLEYPEVSDWKERSLPIGTLRSLITSSQLDAVHKYDKSPTVSKNNAVIIATANPDGSPLLDRVGNRRQAVVTYPFYDSVSASLQAGKSSIDHVISIRSAMLTRGLERAAAAIELRNPSMPQVSIELDPRYDSARISAQSTAAEDDYTTVLRAFLTIIMDAPDWMSEAETDRPIVGGYCPIGGVNPVALRALSYGMLGVNITSQRINRLLLATPGIRRSESLSPIHRNRGLTVTSKEVFIKLVEQCGLTDMLSKAREQNPDHKLFGGTD